MNERSYRSTRNSALSLSASEAVLKGLSDEGGLFVPDLIPSFPFPIASLAGQTYQETAYQVMHLFLTDYTEEELKSCIARAYDEKFDTPEIAPIRAAGGVWFLELFHGKTIAFKDMALSILPHLMTTAAAKHGVKDTIVILTATSGDTGKAALEGFADVPGTKIIVFFPKDGVSRIQKLQMVTQKGENTLVVGVDGNFDDCQSAVKRMFHDPALKEKLAGGSFRFSSANSINIGRLVPQIAYYFHAYGCLLKNRAIAAGDEVNVTVPTGNFGNILAGYYAKRMGLPVKKLICASNENKVLYDFFETGIYDKNREFILTTSPSMDILISSNLERLVYYASGEDDGQTAAWMEELKKGGRYEIGKEVRRNLTDFLGFTTTQEETAKTIRSVYEKTGYVIDPHTAVAEHAAEAYRKETGDETPMVVVSTASPYKFAETVVGAIDPSPEGERDAGLIEKLSILSKIPVPPAVKELDRLPIRHKMEISAEKMDSSVEDFLELR